MNVYRLVGDMSHLFAVLMLLSNIVKSRSCAGISGKSQLLLLLVFLTRYLDLFTTFISYYNTFMKLFFIGFTALTVLCIFVIYRSTYNSEYDTYRVECLLLLAAGLAFYINDEFTFFEVIWAFSIYLEAVAILPQFFMIHKIGEMEMFTYHYLFALGLYRAFYIFNWVYRYRNEGFFDSISFFSGCVQTAFYCYLLYSKEFLKRQAQAHFRKYAAAEKGQGHSLVPASDDVLVVKVCPSVDQLHGDVLLNQKDDGVNSTEQPDFSACGTAQPVVEENPLEGDCGVSHSHSTSGVGETNTGEDTTDSSAERLQPQSQ